MKDTADWDGIIMRSVDVGARKEGRKRWWRGYYYANASEHRLAQLLTRLGVPYTPDVKFTLRTDDGSKRIYIADFVFDTVPFIWTPGGSAPRLIHGLEAKAKGSKGFPPRALENERLLLEQYGIAIPLISNDDILRCFKRRTLPLAPF